MAQNPFKLEKNEQYVECHRPFKLPNGNYSAMVRVYELLRPEKLNLLTNSNWSYEPEIVDPKSVNGYDSLEIDGQLIDLEKLVQDLCKSRLRVNKFGNCYFELRQGVADTTETYGLTFYRMNDIWKWSNYGVNNTDSSTLMCWDHLYILDATSKPPLCASRDYNSGNGRALEDRLAKLETELTDTKAKNQSLMNEVKNFQLVESENVLTKTQLNQQIEEVNKLLAQLKMCQPGPTTSIQVPVPATLFEIKRQPGQHMGYPFREYLNVDFLSSNSGISTPSNQPVTDSSAYKRVIFTMNDGFDFDIYNWVFIRLKERANPMLMYMGTAHYFEVKGMYFYSPLDINQYIWYHTPPEDEDISFGLRYLGHEYGARITIRLWYN